MSKVCAVEGCDRPSESRGLCHCHYQRWWLFGDVRADRPIRPKRKTPVPCSVEGCERNAVTRGLCQAHYMRWRKHGDTQAQRPLMASMRITTELLTAVKSAYAGVSVNRAVEAIITQHLEARLPLRIDAKLPQGDTP